MGRWAPIHYRRSLASRVTLLTTMAVGIAVTGVAFAAYATVRMQSMESIDRSLHARATAAAKPETLASLARQEVPAWALGAGDVKLVLIDGGVGRPVAATDKAAADVVGAVDYQVALRHQSWSARSVMIRGVRYRAVAVPAPTVRPWSCPSRWSRRTGCSTGSAWSCCSSASPG